MYPSEHNKSKPAVTVLLASYGRLEYLKDAVNSALDQDYPKYEILIVDDGSDDKVIDWLRMIESGEPKISVIYQSHQGVAAARARGVEAANTALVCILDSDDRLIPGALEILVDAMLRDDDTQLVFANIREIPANGEAAVRRYMQYDSAGEMILATLLKPRVPFKHSGTLFRRQTALELGSYDIELPCKIDVDFYLKFLEAGYLPVHVDQALVDFRMHKNSVSLDRVTGIKVWLYLIDRYGPVSPVYRFLIKMGRIGAELLKRLYIEVRG